MSGSHYPNYSTCIIYMIKKDTFLVWFPKSSSIFLSSGSHCFGHSLQDKKSVESCCVAFARLVDSFQSNEVRNFSKLLIGKFHYHVVYCLC